MRVIVTGGRNYKKRQILWQALDQIGATCVIQGGAKGADALAREWAYERGLPISTWEANWHRFGRAAGPVRNRWMLEHGSADLVLAFPGHSGTANMVKIAREAGMPVVDGVTGVLMPEDPEGL